MHLINATFLDDDEARLALEELRAGLGIDEVGMAPLADADPPMAQPVLVAARVPDVEAEVASDLLRAHGGAVADLVLDATT